MSLWDAFLDAAGRRENDPALVLPSGDVSFGELTHDAERVAAWLADHGVGKGGVVAIQLPKRREAYAIWLGCLRQGVVYVFVDPKNPPERTRRIVDRVRPRILVVQEAIAEGIEEAAKRHGEVVRLAHEDEGSHWLRGLASAPPRAADVAADEPAYIMFTSGSTGEPKGAVIPQRGVLSLMRWSRTIVDPAQERFANVNPLHFDNSVFDLYGGLVNGATLVPVETGALTNPTDWVKQLRDGGATVVFAVPTWFLTLDRLRQLRPDRLPGVRVFLFGGEGFPIASVRKFHERFKDRARLVNVYGPTETSCICSSVEVTDSQIASAGEALLSLGRMHEDFAYAVLDPEGHQVPRGEVGELWIGGICVGLGYYNNLEETSQRFMPNPLGRADAAAWYRSGDLVREDDDAFLWFQGRADNQVKIRGHRIELEEIDLTVEEIDGVNRAVCVAVPGVDGLELQLVYSGDDRVDADTVRERCESRLPPYMRPAKIVHLETLPQNANGKVDRKAVHALMENAR